MAPRIGIVMGSDSDLPTMQGAIEVCLEFAVPFEARVLSAHRTPLDMLEYGRTAHERGVRVIVAGAGGAAHLPGMLAAASPLPVLIYDIPIRTGRKVSHDVLVRLAHDVPTVVGVKDAAGDPGATARLIAEAPEGFEVYSGDDGLTLPLLSVGAVGVISVETHWAGPHMAEMIGDPAVRNCGTRYSTLITSTTTAARRRRVTEPRRASAKSGTVRAPDLRMGAATRASMAM